MGKRFADKVALVTGAAKGIGKASAQAFAKEGAAVVLGDIDKDGGEAVAQSIRDAGGQATFVECDAASEAGVAALVQTAKDEFGGLDFAHNNAGNQFGPSDFAGASLDEWDQTIGLSLKATWLCMRAEIPLMQERGGGAIVNTSSMAGWRTHLAASAAYSAAKRGVLSLTEYAAVAYAADGIRVNAIAPGLVRTAVIQKLFSPEEQTSLAASTQPIGRIIEPEEIADSVIFLCSEQSAMITGATLPVCGGNNAN